MSRMVAYVSSQVEELEQVKAVLMSCEVVWSHCVESAPWTWCMYIGSVIMYNNSNPTVSMSMSYVIPK